MSVEVTKGFAESVHTQIYEQDMLGLALSLERLKKMGANFSDVDIFKSTILTATEAACFHNRWDSYLLQFLIQNGARITSPDGISNLLQLRESFNLPGMMDIVRESCTKEDVEAEQSYEHSLIVHAVTEGYTEFAELYHKLGGDLATKDFRGKTLLMYACEPKKDNSAVIKLLLDWGASVTDVDLDGKSVFLYACGYLDHLKLLHKYGLIVAHCEAMSDNAELEAALNKYIKRNNKEQYNDLVSLARQDQPSLFISSFEDIISASRSKEENVLEYMDGNFGIKVNALEQRKAIIRKTKKSIESQKHLTSDAWEEEMKKTFQFLDNVASDVFDENNTFVIKAMRLLITAGPAHVDKCLADAKNIMSLVDNVEFGETALTIFEE